MIVFLIKINDSGFCKIIVTVGFYFRFVIFEGM